MSRRKTKTVPDFDADGPHPMRGGAFVLLPDGTLVRDSSEEQHIPDDERDDDGSDLAVSDVPDATSTPADAGQEA